VKKPDLPYLEIKIVKGREYAYFRRGNVRHRLPDNLDSEAFTKAYWEIRSGRRALTCATTWNNLIAAYYQSPEFQNKSAGTKANYRRHCEAIREKNGDKDVRSFKRRHAIAARDALSSTWSKANERLAVLSILCGKAVDLEWIDRNPVTGISKLKGGEYEAWPDAMLDAYERYCDLHGLALARTVYELCVIWCGWRDLNPHALRRQNLNLVRLPISPHPRSGRVLSRAAAPWRERIAPLSPPTAAASARPPEPPRAGPRRSSPAPLPALSRRGARRHLPPPSPAPASAPPVRR
jgi:hypothetical protein